MKQERGLVTLPSDETAATHVPQPRVSAAATRGRGLAVCAFTGISLGMLVFVAARVSNPRPVDPMDVEFFEILGGGVPRVELLSLTGDPVDSRTHEGNTHVLVFAGPACDACEAVYRRITEAAGRGLPVLLVYRNGLEAARRKATETQLLRVSAYDTLGTLSRELHVSTYPTAILVDSRGIVRKAGAGLRSATRVLELAMDPGRSQGVGGWWRATRK